MAFLMPAILLFIFGYAITLDVNRITTVVYDQGQEQPEPGIGAPVRSSGYFTVVGACDDRATSTQYLDTGHARVAVQSRQFSPTSGGRADGQLQVIVDGSDSNTATIALGYIGVRKGAVLTDPGGPDRPAHRPAHPRLVQPRAQIEELYHPGTHRRDHAVIAALLTSLTVAREWERGTMEQLISTPVKVPELIIGKLIPYFAIGFIDVAALGGAQGVPLRGPPERERAPAYGPLRCCSSSAALSLGILISIVAKSQLLASQVAMVVSFLPAFLLSGFMFSISNMPDAAAGHHVHRSGPLFRHHSLKGTFP